MLVSTMSLTEMRDECLKEVQHYIDVAMIKYKQALSFRNKNLNKEFIFKTKRNNNLFIKVKFIYTDTGKPRLLADPYFWFYNQNSVVIIYMLSDGTIIVYRDHVIKRIIQRFRLTYDPKALIRTLIKLTSDEQASHSEIDDNFECHISNKYGVFYYVFPEPCAMIAKTFISRETFSDKQKSQFQQDCDRCEEELEKMSEEEYQDLRRQMGYL